MWVVLVVLVLYTLGSNGITGIVHVGSTGITGIVHVGSTGSTGIVYM